MFFGGDPFEHFAQGGGGGGGRGGGGGGRGARGSPNANVDTTKLYETLGVRCHFVRSSFVRSFFSREECNTLL